MGTRSTTFLSTAYSSCGRRVGVLYAAGKYFRCRHCYDLAYHSQREDLSGRYMGRFHKIRRRLLARCTPEQRDLAGPMDLPPRPKGMHYRTYWKLAEEARLYEQQGLYAIVDCIEGLAIFRKGTGKRESRWR